MTVGTILAWILIVTVPIWVILLLGEFADADLPWRRRRRRTGDASPAPADGPPSDPPSPRREPPAS